MNQRMRRILALSIVAKAGIPLLLGLITIVSANISGVSSRSALELGGLVAGVLCAGHLPRRLRDPLPHA